MSDNNNPDSQDGAGATPRGVKGKGKEENPQHSDSNQVPISKPKKEKPE